MRMFQEWKNDTDRATAIEYRWAAIATVGLAATFAYLIPKCNDDMARTAAINRANTIQDIQNAMKDR